ncbi:MAG: DUF5666 domain-containing protein, partial [Steroidobacteraceae bacterium]
MARSKQPVARGLSMSAVAVFVAAALVGKAQATTLTLGPVEQVNVKSATLVVLGQTYHIVPSTVIRSQGGVPMSLASLSPNMLVSIDGAETATGQSTIQSVTSLSQLYVPGATHLFLTGIVASETPTGQIKVGKLTVDINSTLTSDTPTFSVGSLVKIGGTQPNLDGLFLAQSVGRFSTSIKTSLGVAGGGATSFGVAGGGRKALAFGVAGGGVSSNGVAGGGFSSHGVAGGGVLSHGVAGGGASSLGVAGGGATSFGVAGGGRKALAFGVAGGGVSSNGVAGGGFS